MKKNRIYFLDRGDGSVEELLLRVEIHFDGSDGTNINDDTELFDVCSFACSELEDGDTLVLAKQICDLLNKKRITQNKKKP